MKHRSPVQDNPPTRRVPDGESGQYGIDTFVVTEMGAATHNIKCDLDGRPERKINPGTYQRLLRYEDDCTITVVMSDTPAEMSDHREFLELAARPENRVILINGLGIGAIPLILMKYRHLEKLVIVELEQDVINLTAPTLTEDPRVTVIHKSAFEYEPDQIFDMVWHDIWDTINPDNLPEMEELEVKFTGKARWQGSWAKDQCWEMEQDVLEMVEFLDAIPEVNFKAENFLKHLVAKGDNKFAEAVRNRLLERKGISTGEDNGRTDQRLNGEAR